MNNSLYAAMAMIGAASLTLPALADNDRDRMRMMSLTGIGEVKAEPDLAVITIGVVREAETARAALSANNTAMAAVTAVVSETGVAKKDLQTSGFAINPKYHYPKRNSSGERPEPKITGYTVSNNLSVTVRALDTLGDLLDSVVDAGSNQINGIAFGLSDPKPLEDEARRSATANAISKARLYVEAAGLRLGPIISISEHSRRVLPAQAMANVRAMAADVAESVPIARGEHTISMQVNITWEIQSAQ